ncbi:MAG TPA: hypothetical protein VGQ71_10690 [Terriglobales bacterium]|jgi:hypothetical protein|nr:hypothetical protein [Terriglobales bacterium]
MDSARKEGAAQFVVSVDGTAERRVVQQVSDPCNLRMRAQRTEKAILVETDPIRDCSGNPVPDGTIVTFTAMGQRGRSTVDARIKRGTARTELPLSDGALISVASGVVMGNTHWRRAVRRFCTFAGVVVAAMMLFAAAAAQGPKVVLNMQGAGPRGRSRKQRKRRIVRDYAAAWKALATALSENRAQALDAGFIGDARNKLGHRVEKQKSAGLRTRYIDRGHKLEVLFYSPEGSAMQLRDTANLEMQVLDGDQTVNSQQLTQNYLVVMTVGEDRWKVRVLQEVQSADTRPN